jgi:uncharacterized membrane protein
MERLRSEVGSLVGALGDRAVSSVRNKVEDATGRLTGYVDQGGGPGIMAAVTGAKGLAEGKSPVRAMFGAGMAGLKEKVAGIFRKGAKGGGKKIKLTNIVESIDVGVPIKLAYNQWTQLSDFPKFMKKVENVDQPEEPRVSWKAQVFWSHRTWESTILEQVPDDKIVWRSKGAKGWVDGAVTFHELAPNLTRILVVLEYHPQGLFERTGNIWRAQGRRARLELKHFRRHIMTEGVLHADDIEGWRGTIHDGEVVESHEDALAREEQEGSQRDDSRRSGDGRVDDTVDDTGEDREAAAGEREEDEAQGDEMERDETRDGRPARARAGSGAASRGRRSSGTRSSGTASGGNGRRRTSAAAQRGGNR